MDGLLYGPSANTGSPDALRATGTRSSSRTCQPRSAIAAARVDLPVHDIPHITLACAGLSLGGIAAAAWRARCPRWKWAAARGVASAICATESGGASGAGNAEMSPSILMCSGRSAKKDQRVLGHNYRAHNTLGVDRGMSPRTCWPLSHPIRQGLAVREYCSRYYRR